MSRISNSGNAEHAFGVDVVRTQLYNLRQSRYDALAQDVSDWAAGHAPAGVRLRTLIVGCGSGNELRHLRAKPHFDKIAVSGANKDDAYLKEMYSKGEDDRYDEIFVGDLLEGYPDILSHYYDVVICEQVLEHLESLEVPIMTLERVLKPGGKLIVGVPIFLPPLHLARQHAIPRLDALFSRRKKRGHVRAFSLKSFLSEMRTHSNLTLLNVRGFRVVSGGPLRPLEHYRWWWKFNRWLGRRIPVACIEVQATMEKTLDRTKATAGDRLAESKFGERNSFAIAVIS